MKAVFDQLRNAQKLYVDGSNHWRDTFPITPQQFYNILCADMPGSLSIHMDLKGGKQGDFDITAKTDDGREYFTAERSFFLPGARAKHKESRVAEDLRGKGIARIFMRNTLTLYDQLGIDRIELRAGRENGSYSWARYGFAPECPRFYDQIKENLRKNFDQYKDQLSESSCEAVESAIASTDPKSIWLISDIPEQIDGKPAGHKILYGAEWRGALNLSDPQMRSRLTDYLASAPEYSAPDISSLTGNRLTDEQSMRKVSACKTRSPSSLGRT